MKNSEFRIQNKSNLRLVMCNALLVTFYILHSTFCIAQTNDVNPNGYNKFYYPGGKIESEGTMKEGVPEGYWKTYYEDGTLKSEGNRSNHTLDGDWKFYTEKGIITTEINYKL